MAYKDGARVELPLAVPATPACGEPAIAGADLTIYRGDAMTVVPMMRDGDAFVGSLGEDAGHVELEIDVRFADGTRAGLGSLAHGNGIYRKGAGPAIGPVRARTARH